MNALDVIDALRNGKCIQPPHYPKPWAYVKLAEHATGPTSTSQLPTWFGLGDTWDERHVADLFHERAWVVVDEQTVRARKPKGDFSCPRRGHMLGIGATGTTTTPDHFRSHNGDRLMTCSYCGSVNGTLFIQGLEDGTLKLGPTDKNYKAYVYDADSDAHLGKFYYQHFDDKQIDTFLMLINEMRMKIDLPGHLYVLPYFASRIPRVEHHQV